MKWDLAEWLERLTANSLGFDPTIFRHSGIWGAADEAVLNNVHKNIKKNPPVKTIIVWGAQCHCMRNATMTVLSIVAYTFKSEK